MGKKNKSEINSGGKNCFSSGAQVCSEISELSKSTVMPGVSQDAVVVADGEMEHHVSWWCPALWIEGLV